MSKTANKGILILLFISLHMLSCAQEAPKLLFDFLPRETVVFADNFQDDSAGSFPSKWRLTDCMEKYKFKGDGGTVIADGLENAVAIEDKAETHLEPDITANRTLGDVFTIEYDFKVGPLESEVSIEFMLAEMLGHCRSVEFSVHQSGLLHYITYYPRISETKSHYPFSFDAHEYHHMAVSYYKGTLNIYVDQYHVANIPDTRYEPIKYGLWAKGTSRIKNVSVATGKEFNEFSGLVTEKKLTTHVFYFEPDKGRIMPECMRYIMYLVKILKENPSVKLEIDVHSDDSGDPSINTRLTEIRAGEIKQQLMIAGIAGARLTAKGFGDSKPLKPNNTPENKAANNRVEFIKL